MTGNVSRFADSRIHLPLGKVLGSHHGKAAHETKDIPHDSPARGSKAKATDDSIDLNTLLVQDLEVRELPANIDELKRVVVKRRTFKSGRVMLKEGSPLPRQTLQYLVKVKEYAAAFKLLRMVAPSERVAPLLQLLDIKIDGRDTAGAQARQARQECLKATAMWLWRHEHHHELDALLAKCSPRQRDWLRACMFRKELVSSRDFWVLPTATRNALRAALSGHEGESVFAESLIDLAGDSSFQRLTPAWQADAIDAFDRLARSELDRVSARLGVDRHDLERHMRQVLGNAGAIVAGDWFHRICAGERAQGKHAVLSDAGRGRVLDHLVRFVGTQSYQHAPPPDKGPMLEILGGISAFSAARPVNVTLRNTLDQVAGGRIGLCLYERPPDKTFINWGKANGRLIGLNNHERVRNKSNALDERVGTLVHEVNHVLNGPTNPGTAERFLDEYRATVVGLEAALGRPLTAAEQLEIVDTLVGQANSYAHLSNLYQSDWHFKAAVNEIYDTLGTLHANGRFLPKATVSPARAATILYANGFKSDYMKAGRTGGNLDNADDHTA